MKPILLYWRSQIPDPSKFLATLEELGLPYETSRVVLEDLKKQPFESINPDGRLPGISIQDPNTGITLFESGAINSYLIDTYDKEHKLTYNSIPEKQLLQQWSSFQASGQGPYFGQCTWFALLHPEKLEWAQTRHSSELKRIVGIVDRVLEGK